MAPIHPMQILDAFEPLLTISGGIRGTTDQSQITNLLKVMQEHSTKLMSKCIFCEVLIETSPEILERFLKIGGWDLLCLWVKSSRDVGNVTFLVRLLHLLSLLPMTMDRLRENECPKIVKKLCKHENQEVAQKAGQIIKKWTKIIQTASDAQNGAVSSKEKKRKSTEGSGSESSSKKAKSTGASGTKGDAHTNQESVGNRASRALSAQLTKCESNDTASGEAKSTEENDKNPVFRRPITVKVKQGKFRLDLSVPSPKTNESKSKKKDVDTKKQVPPIKLVDISKNIIKPPPPAPYVAKDSVSFMDALTVVPVVSKKRRKPKEPEPKATSTNQEKKVDPVPDIDVKEMTPTRTVGVAPLTEDNLTNNNSYNNSITHDTSVAKSENNDTDRPSDINVSSEIQKSPPKFSFYKDILDEKCNDSKSATATNTNNTTSNSNSQVFKDVVGERTCDDSPQVEIVDNKVVSEDSDKTDNDEVAVQDISPISPTETGNSVFRLKSILCYVKKDEGKKKSVRWPEDSQLERVKFFEMDETERINVNRPTSDMKRFDMKHEAQLMMEAKKSRCFTYAPWKLVTIDTPPDPVVYGCNSNERVVQAERMQTTLECIFIQNHIPDTPTEPDPEFHLAVSLDQIPIIPHDDQNSGEQSVVQDYTGISQAPPPESSYSSGAFANQQGDYTSFGGAPNNGFSPGQVYQVPSGGTPVNTENSTAVNRDMSGFPICYDGGQQAGHHRNKLGSGTFEGVHGASSGTNSGFNSFNTYTGPAMPPSSIPNAPSAYQPPPSNSATHYPNYSTGGPPHTSPPSMYSSNSNPNYFANNHGQQQAGVNESGFNSTYWPEANKKPPGGMSEYHPPGPSFARGGSRFRGPRGGRGGRFPRTGEMCRFFFKTGKCKYDNRCNFSHSLDNQKPPVRF